MTESQSQIFREVLDLNWEFETSTDWTVKIELARKLSAKKKELATDMGQEAYDKFIETGRRMFAPARN